MRIRFEESLVPLVESGEKDTNWRLWSERDVSPGEKVSLQDAEGEEFAEGEVIWVKNTLFGINQGR